MRTLIGLGCSHTQGCAFITSDTPDTPPYAGIKNDGNKDLYQLCTPQLRKKYKTEYVSLDFINENFTWMGYLNKHLGYEQILNFGRGGQGPEANIRSLYAYSYKVKDLSNHLIIIRIPTFWRKEIFIKKGADSEGYFYGVKPLSMIINHGPVALGESYLQNYFDYNYEAMRFIYSLYFLQDYLEMKGAEFYIWDDNFDIKDTIPCTYKDGQEKPTPISMYHQQLHSMPSIKEIVGKLNIFDMQKNPHQGTLESEDLKDNDKHESEIRLRGWGDVIYEAVCKMREEKGL